MNTFPRMIGLRQESEGERIDDVGREVAHELERLRLGEAVKPGNSIAITVGSRGIANIALIVRSAVDYLKTLGAQPFIVPAMGSHGGATAVGQRQVLEAYGVTESYCGCPIRSDMDTVVVGESPQGFPIHCDRIAFEANHILICNRIKPHTGFAGNVQSGLIKMMLIGLGKKNGATIYHRAAMDFGFDTIAKEIARGVLEKCSVIGGLAIVENSDDDTGLIEAIPPQDIESREPELLRLSQQWMPRLPFDSADVLLIDEIGKNISGTGMDTNVIGRKHSKGSGNQQVPPQVKRVIVRALTPQSKGNACGIGLADFCLDRVVAAMDRESTVLNAVTSLHVASAMIPVSYETDREVLATALSTIGLTSPKDARILWIKNTLKVGQLACSEAYLDEATKRQDLVTLGEPYDLPFNEQGFLPAAVC